MKNIKKQQQQLQTQAQTTKNQQKPTTSSTPEKSQFLNAESSNVEENLIFNPVDREVRSTEESQSNVGKIHRSTSSSSVLEKK